MLLISSSVPLPKPARRPSLLSVIAFSAALFLGLLCISPQASAQVESPSSTAPLATDYEELHWHELVFLSFESGRADRGKVFTEQCLRPRTSQAEIEIPRIIEAPQGPWDVILIYTLDDAPLEKKWETPAELEKLQAACMRADRAKAAALTWDEYNDLIVRSSSLVGFSGRLGPGLAQLSQNSKDP